MTSMQAPAPPLGAPITPPPPTPKPKKRRIPWHMRFPGPVFSKEVWMLGKRPGTSWFRLVYLALLILIVSLVFAANKPGSYQGSAAMLQAYQEVAPLVTMSVAWVQFVMLTLIALALGGPAICDEVRMGTLATLLTTPLQAWQIVSGKLLGRMLELFILALLSVPMLLALRSFGGVPASAILMSTATSLATALLACQIGIFCSTFSKRATGAIVSAFILLLAVLFVPTLVMLAIELARAGLGGRGPGQFFFAVMTSTSSPVTMGFIWISLVAGRAGGPPNLFSIEQFWLINLAYLLGMCAVFFVLTTMLVRRVLVRAAAGAAPKQEKKSRSRSTPTPPPLSDASPLSPSTMPPVPQAGAAPLTNLPAAPTKGKHRRRAVEGSSRTVSDRPVLWREMQQKLFKSNWMEYVALGLIMLIVLAVYYLSAFEEPMALVVACIALAIIGLSAGVVSTGAISTEREGRTLDALLCTPLSAWEIVWGKFLGHSRKIVLSLALLMIHLIVGGCMARFLSPLAVMFDKLFMPKRMWGRSATSDSLHPVALWHAGLIAGSMCVFLVSTGIFFSSRFRKTTTATVFNIGLALGLWLAMPILAVLCDQVLPGNNHVLITGAIYINLPALFAVGIEGATERSSRIFDLTANSYDMPEGNLNFIEFSVLTCVMCAAYLFASWVALKLAARSLSTPTGRRR